MYDFWPWEIFVGIEWDFFWHENFWHLDDGLNLCCRILSVEVASKCWRAYGKHCLQISGISSMMWALVLSLRLYWIKRLMSTRTFSYTLPCQSMFGTLRVLIHHWWGDVDTLRLIHNHRLEVGMVRSMIPLLQRKLRNF